VQPRALGDANTMRFTKMQARAAIHLCRLLAESAGERPSWRGRPIGILASAATGRAHLPLNQTDAEIRMFNADGSASRVATPSVAWRNICMNTASPMGNSD
jgi:hypothetical protein